MNLVFTKASLNSCLQQIRDEQWFQTLSVADDGSWAVQVYDGDDVRFFVHRNDRANSARIVILSESEESALSGLASGGRIQALARIHRAAAAAARPPLWLPPDWSVFHDGNRVAFFATTREYGNLRWIMEQYPSARHDVIFWELTTEERPVLLQNFRPNYSQLSAILDQWPDALAATEKRFAVAASSLPDTLNDQMDLAEISYAAVTQYRSYTTWLANLSDDQLSFVNDDSRSSIKLRGAAGSGKTLTLEIKLLRELYAARKAARNTRILFATHSWAMAYQVDEALRSMDEGNDLNGVEVMPLLTLALAALPRERALSGLRLLGEDSLSGKQEQINLITGLLSDMRTSDWLAFRDRASVEFRTRVESTDPAVIGQLVWDLMNEFASVLSANGILPGVNARRRYEAIARSAWMMPLDATRSDREFVLHVYDRYVSALKDGSAMSSDQLINDFWNYLETFAWNIRREEAGYDIIFIDELHLFSQQERLALNMLTRSADQYPRMYMALDPRQSPTEVYAGIAPAGKRSDSGEADLELGKFQSRDLLRVYRFTSQILELLRHMNRSYPTIENIGEDWVLDLDRVTTSVPNGPKPLLFVYRNLEEEMTAVVAQARESAASADGRVAVVLLDPLLLPVYFEFFEASGLRTILVSSRDEIERLGYVKRGIILSSAEYVAGLQFNTVLCAGFVRAESGVAHSGHHRRRLLSMLYLAISRATFRVVITVNDETSGIPPILGSAHSADIVVMPERSSDVPSR